MKKLLILTASTGEGHNQAALTLESEFTKYGYECHKVDMFKSTHKTMDILVADGYRILASSMPRMYGSLYRKCDNERFNRLFAKRVLKVTEIRINKIIKEVQPDLVIATHPLAVSVMGNLKAKGRYDKPFMQVVTDFKAHYAYVDRHVDAYITASEFTKRSLVKRGISAEKVFAYGIPVKHDFLSRTKKTRTINVEENPFELLIMGGSMGLKPMERVVQSVAENPRNVHMTVVCGNNKSLKETLENRFSEYIKNGRMSIFGFVSNIPELMEHSHIIVTKPGGLTTSEAINMSIPMLIPFSIPGQEQENTDYLVRAGMAMEVEDPDQINECINKLMDDPQMYDRMRKNMMSLSRKYSLSKIVELAEKSIDSKTERTTSKKIQGRDIKFFEHVQ